VIIGNEVLTGRIEEKNSAFFVRRFRALGVRLREVCFVEDRVDAIADTLRRLAPAHDQVVTSGGIGPTHDDVTIEAVAAAFDAPVVESPALVSLLERLLGARATPGHLRMARIPEGGELVFGGDVRWPVLKMANVYIFPGVPWLLRSTFEAIESRFACETPLLVGAFAVASEEALICERLDAVAARHGLVEIGSYPRFDGLAWSLRLTLESTSWDAIAAAARDVRRELHDVITAEEPVAPLGAKGD